MATIDVVLENRRTLLETIFAIHDGDGRVRLDARATEQLNAAWDDYDAALTAELHAELAQLRPEHERMRSVLLEIGQATDMHGMMAQRGLDC